MKRSLAVILSLGFVFRLVCLGTRQLWTDELLQALVVRAPSLTDVLVWLKGGVIFPAPLDYLVQKGFVTVFGDSSWGLRLHAAIFGALSLWIFFRIGRLLFGARAALYCTALFAFFPLHYHYSQEGRPYALVVLLALVSYDLLLHRLSAKEDRVWGWLLLGAVLVLLLYSSILGFAVVLSQLLTLGCAASFFRPAQVRATAREAQEGGDLPPARWSQFASLAALALVAFALFVPWLQFAWSKPMIAHAREITSPKLALRIIKELGDNSYPVAGLLLLGVITGVRALLRHEKRQCLLWLVAWFGVPIAAALVFDIWSRYPFAIRDVIFATPPLVLLSGYGVSHVGERMTILEASPYRPSSVAIVYAAAMIIGCFWIAQNRWRQDPVDWIGTARALQGMIREGDALTIPAVYPLLEYYAPALEQFRKTDLDPRAGSLDSGHASRRIVVCYDGMMPDPCAGFRDGVRTDRAWSKLEFRGFTVFLRQK